MPVLAWLISCASGPLSHVAHSALEFGFTRCALRCACGEQCTDFGLCGSTSKTSSCGSLALRFRPHEGSVQTFGTERWSAFDKRLMGKPVLAHALLVFVCDSICLRCLVGRRASRGPVKVESRMPRLFFLGHVLVAAVLSKWPARSSIAGCRQLFLAVVRRHRSVGERLIVQRFGTR